MCQVCGNKFGNVARKNYTYDHSTTVCPKIYQKIYGKDEKGSKMSTKYEQEVIRKLEGREQRIEERFREGLRQLLRCSSILTTISLHCIEIRHVYYSKYLLIIWGNMYSNYFAKNHADCTFSASLTRSANVLMLSSREMR